MSRLTQKNGDSYVFERLSDDGQLSVRLEDEPIDKLGKLEDIEDKWGIGLDVLYKALTQQIIYIREDGIAEYCSIEHFVPSMKGQELHTRGRSSMMHDKNFLAAISTPYKYGEVHLGLKDYRKMKPGGWALTQEDFMREETK